MQSVGRACVEDYASPIDLVEDLAALRSWDVDRLDDDQIAMAVEGVWRTYSISLAWYEPEETLRMVCTFKLPEIEGEQQRARFYEAIEAANDRLWIGGFNLWREQGLMAYRYGLTLEGGAVATCEQIDALMRSAIENCERYFPAFQLIGRSAECSVEEAMSSALLQPAGSA